MYACLGNASRWTYITISDDSDDEVLTSKAKVPVVVKDDDDDYDDDSDGVSILEVTITFWNSHSTVA